MSYDDDLKRLSCLQSTVRIMSSLLLVAGLTVVAAAQGTPAHANPSSAQEKRIQELISSIDERTGYGPYSFPSVDELAKIGKPAVPFLIEALSDRSRRGNYAAKALGKIGPDAASAVPALIRVLDYEPHRWDAVDGLRGIGPAAKPAVPRLIKILEQSMGGEDSLDQIVALALGSIGDAQAISILRSALSVQEDDMLQGSAAKALGELGDTRTTPALIELYNTNDERVRVAAIEALWTLKDPKAIPTLVDALNDDEDTVNGFAQMGLVDLSKQLAPEHYIELLVNAVQNQSKMTRQRVIHMLQTANFKHMDTARQRLLGTVQKPLSLLFRKDFPGGSVRYVDFDRDGNVHVIGQTVSKFGSGGSPLWTTSLPDVSIKAMALDSKGSLYLAGLSDRREYVAAKVDSHGNISWMTHSGIITTRWDEEPKSIAVSPDGKVYVAGTYYGSDVTDKRIVLIRYTPDGKQHSVSRGTRTSTSKVYGVPERDVATSPLLKVDHSGHVFAMFRKSFATPELVLAHFDERGTLQWTSPCEGFDHLGPSSIIFDHSGTIYLAGKSTTSKARIIKISPDGAQVWAKTLQGEPISSIDVGQDGSIYIVWQRWPTPKAAVLAKLARNGDLLSTEHLEYSTGKEEGAGIVKDLAVGPRPGIIVGWRRFVIKERRFDDPRSALIVYQRR